MHIENPDSLKWLFRQLNPFLVLHFRLGLAGMVNALPDTLGRIMVLVHTGRKSGLRRLTPINYAPSEGAVYCVAGFGAGSDWYKNISAHPGVELWLPDGLFGTAAWRGTAEEVQENRLPHVRDVLIASGFAASAFGGIDARAMSDEALDAATKDYRLMRIRLEEHLPSPVDLAWVWLPVGAVFALWFLMRQWYSRKLKNRV